MSGIITKVKEKHSMQLIFPTHRKVSQKVLFLNIFTKSTEIEADRKQFYCTLLAIRLHKIARNLQALIVAKKKRALSTQN